MSQPTRRDFLQTSLGVAVAAACAPTILKAQDKAVTKPLIVGSGDHTYEVLDNWAKLPDNIHFGNTHSVQETADGRIIVHHTGHQSTCIFDPDGKFIESWGEYPGHAHGMDLHKEGNEEFLYLAPTGMHKTFKTDLKGNVLMTLEYPKDAKDPKTGAACYASEKPYVPTFTAFAPNGDFYITDGYGAGYIHRYNAKGEYQSTFGGKGNEDDRTACPHGIYCDERNPNNPLIVVADREHHRLQYFALDGKLDHLVKNDTPEQDKDDSGKFRRPCHFNVRGTEMVVPDLRGRVTVLDKDNNVLAQLGDNPNPAQRAVNGVKKEALTPGAFCCPHGATFDRAGNIYVAEWLPYGRVTKLRHVSA